MGLSPPYVVRCRAGSSPPYAGWQRRFSEHQIRDERDFARHADYIHYNPVKHGHAETAAAWPHSSFHAFVAKGIYPPDWAATNTGVQIRE